jgi:hypothetical protein
VSRRLAWAPAAVAAYILLALASVWLGLPHRPVFDGLAPTRPYRWVDPPRDLTGTNRPPLSGNTRAPMGPDGSQAATFSTGDVQAQVTFGDGAFPAVPDARAVQVDIRPLDPDELGPPPRGMRFDSNAYTFEASYLPSGDPAEPSIDGTVVLRYARHGTVMLRWSGTAWERLPTEQIRASLTVFATIDRLGTLAVAGPPVPPPQPFPWATLAILSGGAALLAGALGVRARRKQTRSRQIRRQQARRKEKKPPPRRPRR